MTKWNFLRSFFNGKSKFLENIYFNLQRHFYSYIFIKSNI